MEILNHLSERMTDCKNRITIGKNLQNGRYHIFNQKTHKYRLSANPEV